MEADYISTSELAARYRRSSRTIARWRREAGFPAPAYPSSGAENLYRVDEVLAWEARHFKRRVAA